MLQIKSKEKSEIVRAACAKFKDLPSLTLARVLYKKHRRLFPSLEAARCAVTYRRGNRGNEHRKRVTNSPLVRPCSLAGFVWEFPKSSAPSYAPVHLDTSRTLILSDIHIPFHDRAAIEAVIERSKTLNPNCILINGDLCDFFSISRFDKNPTESSLKKELDLTRQFLGWLRQTFPKARIVYKLGNHDEWFDKYLFRKAPELYGVTGVSLKHLTTAKIDSVQGVKDIEWLDDQQKIMIGKLNIYHGHELGKGSIAPPVNPARGLFMRTIECGLQGHLHKDSQHSETTANGKLITTWSTGCLCGLWPRYARVNKWTHSAAFVELNRGQFSVTPLRVLNGQLL
jgi:predicted phosphodiesterase